MNQIWKNFLLSQQAVFAENGTIGFPYSSTDDSKRIMPIANLAILKVAGADAARLLQGQMTCNVNDIGENQGSLGAFCNPKGRAIATFFLVRADNAYLLILPCSLLVKVKNRLEKYILRSDVTFTDCSNELCLVGLTSPGIGAGSLFACAQDEVISINFSTTLARHLIIVKADQAANFWSDMIVNQGFQPTDSDVWRYRDLIAGIPWLDEHTSEEYIPQMINLDCLGGISFNKGCYTGQEIVARTHYLGKAKRSLFLAECDSDTVPSASAVIIDTAMEPAQNTGHVLAAIRFGDHRCFLQTVLQLPETGEPNLTLIDFPNTRLRIIPFNL